MTGSQVISLKRFGRPVVARSTNRYNGSEDTATLEIRYIAHGAFTHLHFKPNDAKLWEAES